MASLSMMYSKASQHIKQGSCSLDGLARGDKKKRFKAQILWDV